MFQPQNQRDLTLCTVMYLPLYLVSTVKEIIRVTLGPHLAIGRPFTAVWWGQIGGEVYTIILNTRYFNPQDTKSFRRNFKTVSTRLLRVPRFTPPREKKLGWRTTKLIFVLRQPSFFSFFTPFRRYCVSRVKKAIYLYLLWCLALDKMAKAAKKSSKMES